MVRNKFWPLLIAEKKLFLLSSPNNFWFISYILTYDNKQGHNYFAEVCKHLMLFYIHVFIFAICGIFNDTSTS